ncbi:MAG: rRNA maturation RNase YbeY [Vampirovibrionales bacterium]|nr:rRNA maturation RNase YbeY [Vampirovibrionales bacterium]
MTDFPQLTQAALLSEAGKPLSFSLWVDDSLMKTPAWADLLNVFHRLPKALYDTLEHYGVLMAYGLPAAPFQGQIHLHLLNNSDIQALNRAYRGKDEATDVLSFPMFEPNELAHSPICQLPTSEAISLGDVVISVEFGLDLMAAGKPVHAPTLDTATPKTTALGGLKESPRPPNTLQCNNSDILKISPNAPNVLILRYLIERAVHGSLHVLGYHHESDIAYNQVVMLQHCVLNQLFDTAH